MRQKLSQEERRTRSHRLIVRGAVFESIVPEAKTMTDEEAAAFLRLALTSEEARAYLKKTHRRAGKANNPFGTKGALIHPYGCVRSAEGLSPTEKVFPRSDMAALPQQGAAPLAPLTRLSLHTHKNSTPAVGVCTIFAGFIILSGR